MALSGSYYMQQRGIPGSGAQPDLHMSPNIRPLPNPNLPFQSSIGGGSIGSTLPLESSSISAHGINMGAPPGAPPGEPVKRKRGRPRKYGADGTVSLALTSTPTSSGHPGALTQSQKRGRGRPPGTGKKQQLASLGKSLLLCNCFSFTFCYWWYLFEAERFMSSEFWSVIWLKAVFSWIWFYILTCYYHHDYLNEQWQNGFKSQHSLLFFFFLILKRERCIFF